MGRRRFATFLAKANELARKPGLSAFSWVGEISWDMWASSSSDSVEDEAGDAGSRGEFMADRWTPYRECTECTAATARGFTSRAARRRCVMSYDACAVVTGGRGRQSESRACTIIIR